MRSWRTDRSAVRAILLGGALALILAACAPPEDEEDAAADDPGDSVSDEDEGEDGSDDDGADDEASGDVEPVRIGVLFPVSGPIAGNGQDAKDGWDLYWDNREPEVNGVPIEIFFEDTQGDPTVGLSMAETLVERRDVDFVVGPMRGDVGLAVGEYLGRTGVPNFSPVSAADELTQHDPLDNYIRLAGWTGSQTTHPFGEWAFEQGYEQVMTSCADYAFGHQSCGGFVSTFRDAGGEVLEPQLWSPVGELDFSTMASTIRDANPDAVFAMQVGVDANRFIEAWDSFGLKDDIPLLTGLVTLDQNSLREMGPEAEGIISVGHWAEGRDVPETREFVEAYDEAYGLLPSYNSAAAFSAAVWIGEALENAGGDVSDMDAFLDVIRDTAPESTPMGPMSMDEFDNPVFNVYIRQVEEREDGRLWNVPIETIENVSQFWEWAPDEYLSDPVYSRDFQGPRGQ